jgi:phenylacetate-CoA ligase
VDRLHGRTDDMVIFRGVNFYPRQVESLLLEQPGAGPEYQLVLERAPGGSDRLTLLLEVAEGFDAAGVGRLRSGLKQHLHLSPEITLLKAGELPRAPGKAVRVVDRRQAE